MVNAANAAQQVLPQPVVDEDAHMGVLDGAADLSDGDDGDDGAEDDAMQPEAAAPAAAANARALRQVPRPGAAPRVVNAGAAAGANRPPPPRNPAPAAPAAVEPIHPMALLIPPLPGGDRVDNAVHAALGANLVIIPPPVVNAVEQVLPLRGGEVPRGGAADSSDDAERDAMEMDPSPSEADRQAEAAAAAATAAAGAAAAAIGEENAEKVCCLLRLEFSLLLYVR